MCRPGEQLLPRHSRRLGPSNWSSSLIHRSLRYGDTTASAHLCLWPPDSFLLLPPKPSLEYSPNSMKTGLPFLSQAPCAMRNATAASFHTGKCRNMMKVETQCNSDGKRIGDIGPWTGPVYNRYFSIRLHPHRTGGHLTCLSGGNNGTYGQNHLSPKKAWVSLGGMDPRRLCSSSSSSFGPRKCMLCQYVSIPTVSRLARSNLLQTPVQPVAVEVYDCAAEDGGFAELDGCGCVTEEARSGPVDGGMHHHRLAAVVVIAAASNAEPAPREQDVSPRGCWGPCIPEAHQTSAVAGGAQAARDPKPPQQMGR